MSQANRDRAFDELSELLTEHRLNGTRPTDEEVDALLHDLYEQDEAERAESQKERDHQLELRKLDVEQSKHENKHRKFSTDDGQFWVRVWMVVFTAIVAVVAIIVGAITYNSDQNRADPNRGPNKTEIQTACIKAGGTWLPGEIFNEVPNSTGLCVMGQSEQ